MLADARWRSGGTRGSAKREARIHVIFWTEYSPLKQAVSQHCAFDREDPHNQLTRKV